VYWRDLKNRKMGTRSRLGATMARHNLLTFPTQRNDNALAQQT